MLSTDKNFDAMHHIVISKGELICQTQNQRLKKLYVALYCV